jgi:hypothetical protein
MSEAGDQTPRPGDTSGEPVSKAERGPGAGSRLPAAGGGKDLMVRDDGEVVGVSGRADGADLTPEDASGSGPGGGGGE